MSSKKLSNEFKFMNCSFQLCSIEMFWDTLYIDSLTWLHIGTWNLHSLTLCWFNVFQVNVWPTKLAPNWFHIKMFNFLEILISKYLGRVMRHPLGNIGPQWATVCYCDDSWDSDNGNNGDQCPPVSSAELTRAGYISNIMTSDHQWPHLTSAPASDDQNWAENVE